MSKRQWYVMVVSSLLLLCFTVACDTTVKTDEAEIGEAMTAKSLAVPTAAYKVDTAKSELTWVGAKMTGRHNGNFHIQNGELYLQDSSLSGGTITIDMQNLRTVDKKLDEANNKKLTQHLKSADFFDAETYPTAQFEITSSEPFDSTRHKRAVASSKTDRELRVENPTHRITGNLTIKGTTKSVTFPAEVKLEDEMITARANFNIDRTKWGLVYNADEALGNQTIYEEVNIGFNIEARKQE